LGGTLAIRSEPAARVMSSLGTSLGLDAAAAAEGVLRVAEARVEAALRVVSVERGKDPRGHALLSFGGAGPLHQGRLARDLGCPVSIVPPNPGVLAALGLLMAPASVDAARTHVRDLGTVTAGELEAAWGALEGEARSMLAEKDGSERLVRSADCRYRGQAYELAVPAPDGIPAAIAAAFHQAHLERYGYIQPQETVEIVNLRVRVEGPDPDLPLPRLSPGRGATAALAGTRRVVLEGEERDCPVFRRDGLGEGDQIGGPAILAGLDSTCLILEGQRADVDVLGNLLIRER
ncbi:MAG TPA: hydantoinase/oxoprolinase family protein, partial [Actinomycetota bacterium]